MRQYGYVVTVGPDVQNGKVEQDLFTCGHCQKVVTFEPGQMPEDAGGMCKQCSRLICKGCYFKQGCDVFEKKLDRMEARLDFLRSAGI